MTKEMAITTDTSPLEFTRNGNSLDLLEELRPFHFTNGMSEDIFGRVQNRIFRYALSRTGNIQDAQDISSEVIIKAVEKISSSQYSDRGISLMVWISAIARNEVIDFVRHKSRYPEAELPEKIVDHLSNDPGELVEKITVLEDLRRAISELPEAQREVMILRFAAGLSVSETAKALHKRENTVKANQSKGMHRLRLLLTPKYPELALV